MTVADPMLYRDEDFPKGLLCPTCGHVFSDGEPIAENLIGFQDDIPIVTLGCRSCQGWK